jgi:hypothetical protein
MYDPALLDLADEIKATIQAEITKATAPLLDEIAALKTRLEKVASEPRVEIYNRPEITPAPVTVIPAPSGPVEKAAPAPAGKKVTRFKINRENGEMSEIVKTEIVE